MLFLAGRFGRVGVDVLLCCDEVAIMPRTVLIYWNRLSLRNAWRFHCLVSLVPLIYLILSIAILSPVISQYSNPSLAQLEVSPA